MAHEQHEFGGAEAVLEYNTRQLAAISIQVITGG